MEMKVAISPASARYSESGAQHLPIFFIAEFYENSLKSIAYFYTKASRQNSRVIRFSTHLRVSLILIKNH